MLHIENFEDGIELYKALGSEVRVEIIRQLLLNKGMNMNELADDLNPHLGTQGFVQLYSVLEILYMKHNSPFLTAKIIGFNLDKTILI